MYISQEGILIGDMPHPVHEEGPVHGGQFLMVPLQVNGTNTVLLLQLACEVE